MGKEKDQINMGRVHGAPESINLQILEPQIRDAPIIVPLVVIEIIRKPFSPQKEYIG